MTQAFRYPHALVLVGIALFLVFGELAAAQQPVFTRNLSLGSRGADVKELQKILNSNPETQVALSGPGSKGQETEYFGILTKNAIIAFQNKHKKDILDSLGLNFGTGFVGPKTLANLNKIAVSPAVSRQRETFRPRILSIFPDFGLEESVITIKGEGFVLDANTIHTIYDSIYGVPSVDGKTLVWKFEEPKNQLSQEEIDKYTKDANGQYHGKVARQDVKPIIDENATQPIMFYIENSNGSSNIFIFTRFFK